MSYIGVREFANETPEQAEASRQAIAAEREERLSRAQAEQQATQAAQAAQKREALETMLQGRWLSNGGRPEEWASAKDEVVAAYLTEQALHGDDAARVAQAARYQ